jgi:amino acid transporter
VTVMSSIYFLINEVSTVFFLISALTVALYLIAYMLMYAAAITLRNSEPRLAQPFMLPGGLAGIWVTSGVGFVGALFRSLVAFFPLAQLPVGSPTLYVTLVIVGTVLLCGIPLVIHEMRSSRWIRHAQPAE